MPAWSPETWGDFSVVGVVVFIAILLWVGIAREWIIPGPAHRAIVASKDDELKRADARSTKDAETIHIQAQTIAEKNAVEAVTTHLLQSFRESVERGA
jgi:hypothetical protein